MRWRKANFTKIRKITKFTSEVGKIISFSHPMPPPKYLPILIYINVVVWIFFFPLYQTNTKFTFPFIILLKGILYLIKVTKSTWFSFLTRKSKLKKGSSLHQSLSNVTMTYFWGFPSFLLKYFNIKSCLIDLLMKVFFLYINNLVVVFSSWV